MEFQKINKTKMNTKGIYLDNFTTTIEEKPVFFIIDAAQIVHRIISKCLQIKCYLSYNDCWAHKLFIGIFRNHLHV